MQKEIEVIEEITTEEDIDKNDPAYNENNESNESNENREFYVYAHIRLDKMETFYIGKGKGERAYDLERNDHHDNISNMCGHAVIIIEDNLTEDEAYWLERDTIEDYVFNLGYGINIEGHNDYDHELPHLTNMNWGGRGVTSGIHHSEEAKMKMSESKKGKNNSMYGKHHSEETKKNMSESKKGKNHPFYGKHHSDETKKNMSESKKGKNNPMYGKHHSDETKKNMSESKKGKNNFMYGKHHSEEAKQKMSESHKGKQAGKNNPMYGKHHSEETKKKMSKKVICVTTGEIFNSIKYASNCYNVARNSISSCCRGTRKSAGKLNGTPLKWKYVKDYNNEFNGILINPIIDKRY